MYGFVDNDPVDLFDLYGLVRGKFKLYTAEDNYPFAIARTHWDIDISVKCKKRFLSCKWYLRFEFNSEVTVYVHPKKSKIWSLKQYFKDKELERRWNSASGYLERYKAIRLHESYHVRDFKKFYDINFDLLKTFETDYDSESECYLIGNTQKMRIQKGKKDAEKASQLKWD